jgi:hypothetical protein
VTRLASTGRAALAVAAPGRLGDLVEPGLGAEHRWEVGSTPASTSEVAITRTRGSGMTLRTGKSGRYRYYTCAGCAQTAKSKCPGRSIAMEVLDGMLLEHLGDKLFTPQRLQVKAYVVRSAEADAGRREQL